MSSLNKVTLIGNVGKDPETRTYNDTTFCNISIATSEKWKDKQTGEGKEKTEWHRVIFIGQLAEIVAKYVGKGDKIYIEGKLETRKWEKNGVDMYTTEIKVDSFSGKLIMLGSKDGGQSGGQGDTQAPPRQGEQRPAQSAPQGGSGNLTDMDDDIPF